MQIHNFPHDIATHTSTLSLCLYSECGETSIVSMLHVSPDILNNGVIIISIKQDISLPASHLLFKKKKITIFPHPLFLVIGFCLSCLWRSLKIKVFRAKCFPTNYASRAWITSCPFSHFKHTWSSIWKRQIQKRR